jgi:hypothetical protein
VDEAADPGGRPRFGGAAGCTGSAPVCGLRRSTETASSMSPTCSRKTFSPRSRTALGPAYSGAASAAGSPEWAGGSGLVGTWRVGPPNSASL